MRTTPRLKVAARLTVTSTECEYPVTKPGISRETIDVSEVADFSVDQQQHAEVEASRKKRFLASGSFARRLCDRPSHPKPPKGGFPTAPRGGTYFGAEIV